MVRLVPRCSSSLVLLCLLIAPGLIAASLPDNDNYLHLVERHRKLRGSTAEPNRQDACQGVEAGEPIPGRYIVVFDTSKVSTVSEGVAAVRQSLQKQALQPQPSPTAAAQTTPVDPFAVVNTLTTVPEHSSGQRRRLLGRRSRRSPYLGAVVTVPPGPAGDALVQSISAVPAVKAAVPDVCVKALVTQEPFSCLPATMLSSSIQTPVASATWEGCFNSNTHLAWYGERCGGSFSQVLWTGVYAFDKTTGARLASCVKQRPATGTLSTDLKFWLGECGASPAALPTVPSRVCRDAYVPDTVIPAEQQGCMSFNFTDAVQTAEIFHPVPGCGTPQPVSMTYKGTRCSGSGGAASSSAIGSVLWQIAEPAAGSGLDASKCSLQRRTGTAAEDLIFNMDWFGSCGVPPARVQYIARSECPATPPPPPPSPSPRPEDQKALDRVPMLRGEEFGTGMPRIQSVMPNASNPSGWDTVRILRPTAVAVMDSGVDCFHRDLDVIYNISFAVVNAPNDEKGCWDVFNHGTNVAGIIGAKNNGFGVVGVLPDTPIVSIKILDESGKGPSSAIISGCMWLMQTSLDGVTPNEDNLTNAEALGVDVINMSFGFTGSPGQAGDPARICEIMRRLREELGIVSVAAAGNEGEPLNNMMPAACEGVIAVTAIDQKNGSIDVTNEVPTWSRFLNLDPNSPVPMTPFKDNFTIAAPGLTEPDRGSGRGVMMMMGMTLGVGMRIWSTCYQQCAPYCSKSGTSQATPHVAGMMARCFSGGRCKSRGNGTESVWYAVRKWQEYNLDLENLEYGFSKDPIRWSKSIFYYGYLTNADVW